MDGMQILINQFLKSLKLDPEKLQKDFKASVETIAKTRDDFSLRIQNLEESLKRIETHLGVKTAEIIELLPPHAKEG